jgi:hypothetical protein
MAVTVQLPQAVEQQLRAEFPDLERHIVEGWAVEAYRRGELSSYQVGQILGLGNRWETIEFLSKHGVYPNYGVEQFEEDVSSLGALKGRWV